MKKLLVNTSEKMKKQWIPLIAVTLILSSCLDFDLPNVNGMWQLKTIQSEDGNIQAVDTIFYSFQRQAIFSYTILHEREQQAAVAEVIYGYVEFPGSGQLHLLLDEKEEERGRLEKLLLWEGENKVTYHIVKLNSKRMVLARNNKTYNFIKY
ncbi:MAG: lipocalin-like domain-containing protein [Dysgonamonadaceae bacterium]|jgi:dihydroorotase-like cyclic amidohydrolase|nr:lipocalin-like domain-containing protein [Dysgonamonadaceae bacterium]